MKIQSMICIAVSLFILPFAFAEPPDAGSIFREQRAPSRMSDQLPKADEDASVKAEPVDHAVKVVVKGFRFAGIGTMTTEGELRELLKDAIGREENLSGLQALARRVTSYLRDKGYFLARATLPQQDITEGIIEIAVMAGNLDGTATVRISDNSRIRKGILQRMMDSGVKNGEPLNDGQLERSLLLINDLPGVTAKGTLERGAAAGSTRVLIDAVEGPLFSGGLSVDNFGNYYTGVWRGSGFASVNDPFGVGDRLSVSLTGEEKLHQEKIGYSSQLLPIGLTGNLSYTHLGYKLGEELKSLDAHGHADSITAGVGYPIVRRRAISLWANTGYEYRMMTDYAGGVETKDREINAGTAELYSSVYDRLGGGALTSFRLALLGGDLTLRNNTNSVIDGLTARTAGRYTKLNYTIERLQRLVPDISLFGSVNGQFADGNLDSSEKFSLGGPTGIRAYPVGEASGDEGHNFTVELRYDTPMPSSYGSLQLFGFCDSGIVTLNKNLWTNAVTTATGNNTYWISGTGLGLNYRKSGVLALSGTWAHTIGGNDGRSTNGKDSDNSSSNNRFWLQATVWF